MFRSKGLQRPGVDAVVWLVLLLLWAPSRLAEAEELPGWRSLGLEEALSEAQQRGTMVLVDVYATWCGPCHKLDRETFPEPGVRAVTDALVAIKVDGETEAGERLVERYHVVGYPTVLLLRGDGTEVGRVFGFVDAATFAELVSGYQTGHGTLEEQVARLATSPADLALRKEVFFGWVLRGNEVEALRQAEELRRRAPDDAALHAELHYQLGKYLYLRGRKDYALALTYFQELQRRWPDSEWAKDAGYPKARALLGDGQEDAAFAELQSWIDGSNDEALVGACNAAAWFCFKENRRLAWGAEVARRGLAVDPKEAGLLDTLAELLYAQGDQRGAIAAIEQAMAADPDPYYVQQRQKFEGAR